jgi:cholesterol transport system auxiliary component
MIRNQLNRLLCLALFGLAFTLSGCFQDATADRKYYVLDAVREGGPAKVHTDATLRIRRFNVDEAFAGRQLTHRLDEFRYESDYYHQFLVLPGIMITEETRDWLADSNLFGRVTSVGSRVESTYMLEGNVIDLYADFTNKSAPMAIVAIRFFILMGPDANETVILAQTYKAEAPISANTAEAVVEAFSKSLDDILARLEIDVEKTLARKPDKSLP